MDTSAPSKETKQCEHCEKDIHASYYTCPLCGGHQSETASTLAPDCPRCSTPLKIHVCDGEEYDICPQCGGMWLDRVEFHRATKEHTVFKKVTTNSEYRKTPITGTVDYIPCVRCGKLMNRRNFGKISGVLIDRCKRHGVWLDAGELDKIQHFIADGGLDRSRDREIERNSAKIQDLATTVGHTAFLQKVLHFWNFKRWIFRR